MCRRGGQHKRVSQFGWRSQHEHHVVLAVPAQACNCWRESTLIQTTDTLSCYKQPATPLSSTTRTSLSSSTVLGLMIFQGRYWLIHSDTTCNSHNTNRLVFWQQHLGLQLRLLGWQPVCAHNEIELTRLLLTHPAGKRTFWSMVLPVSLTMLRGEGCWEVLLLGPGRDMSEAALQTVGCRLAVRC